VGHTRIFAIENPHTKLKVTMASQQHAVCTACNAVNRIPVQRDGKEINCGKCHKPLFGEVPPSLNQSAFVAQVTKSDVPVVVDFWAPWCGPCKAMAPAFAQVSARMDSRAQFIKVNTDEEQGLGAQYGIRSIPTLAIFQSGKEIARTSGAMPAAALEQWVSDHIGT
jgi:thioredoxin 2